MRSWEVLGRHRDSWGGPRKSNLFYNRFERKEQTLSFAVLLTLKSDLLRFCEDFLRLLFGFTKNPTLLLCFSPGFAWEGLGILMNSYDLV